MNINVCKRVRAPTVEQLGAWLVSHGWTERAPRSWTHPPRHSIDLIDVEPGAELEWRIDAAVQKAREVSGRQSWDIAREMGLVSDDERLAADLAWLGEYAAAKQWVFILKADGERPPRWLPWTAAMLGIWSSHATTPHEAVAKLRLHLEKVTEVQP